MPVSKQLENQHLLWRAGFGPAVYQLDDLYNSSPNKLYNSLQKASSKKPEYLEAAGNYLQGLMLGIQEAGRQQKEMSPEQKKELRQKSREGIRNLNLYWINEMVNSDAQLREKIERRWIANKKEVAKALGLNEIEDQVTNQMKLQTKAEKSL